MNGVIAQKIMGLILLICLLISFESCSFPGQVYLSISWEFDYDIPDLTFICDVPGIPDDINDIVKGAYYYARPDTYTVTYNYTDSTTLRTLSFTLEVNTTILGNENAYYDLLILKYKDPAIYEVPVGL